MLRLLYQLKRLYHFHCVNSVCIRSLHLSIFSYSPTDKEAAFFVFFPPNFNIPSQIEGSPLPCDFSFFYASLMFRIFFRCCFFLLDYRFYNSLLFFNFPIGIAILTEDIPTLLISFLRKAIF